MNKIIRSHRSWQALVAGFSLAVLVACGGGGGVGGDLGSGGSGITAQGSGTVTGFGSVIVDGVHYLNSDSIGRIERRFGESATEEVKLGQQVLVEFEGGSYDDSTDPRRPRHDGINTRVEILPKVIGLVDSVDTATSSLRVMSQLVVVNADSAAGPVTQFGNVSGLTALAAGDVVEVHGIVRVAGQLVASRVEKLTTAPTQWVVAGTVTGLDTTTPTTPSFDLGQLRVTVPASQVRPAGAVLADGQQVVVFGLPADYQVVGADSTLTALGLVIRQSRGTTQAGVEDYLGGLIQDLVLGQTFTLNGVPVNYAGVTAAEDLAAVGLNRYVRVQGSFATDGTFIATRIRARSDESEFEFRGNILALDTAAQTLEVQDTLIDWAGVTPDFSRCPGAGGQLAIGMRIEVEGVSTPTGIRATEIECEDSAISGGDGGGDGGGSHHGEQFRGAPSAVNTTTRQFTLSTNFGTTVTVRWTDQTFFKDVDADSLASTPEIEVSGTFEGNVLVASKIELHDSND